jgi:glycosyltransferase 2 family protein
VNRLAEAAPDENGALLSATIKTSVMNKAFQSKIFRIVVGYLVAAVCLVWVFHDTNWKALTGNIAAINWWWVSLGVLFNVLSTFSQGYRWHLLLKPMGAIRIRRATQAVFSGFFINDILPLRVGEIARGYIVSVWLSKEFVSIIPSMALERLFEGVWLAIGIGLTAIFVPLPRNLDRAADIFGLIVLALVGLVLFITMRKRRVEGKERAESLIQAKWLRELKSLLERLGDGFRSIGLSRNFFLAFFVSLFFFVFQAFSFWFITKAYGLHFSFWVGAAILFIIIFGTALPNIPANIGTYQFFSVVGLTLFGVGKTAAAGFSIVAFAFLTLPPLAIGFFALARSGMTLASIKEKIKRQKL